MNERILNNYYNIGKFNHPSRIGYMMKMIRELKPLTQDEWRLWYYNNVHDEQYVKDIASEMHSTIPVDYCITIDDCLVYVEDVMFRRTFNGYNKEKLSLKLLREYISPDVKESPADWDTKYFIDFYLETHKALIGIQLKPDTFYRGNYQYKVDIHGKMKAFERAYNALSFILLYQQHSSQDGIVFANPEVLDEIKSFV